MEFSKTSASCQPDEGLTRNVVDKTDTPKKKNIVLLPLFYLSLNVRLTTCHASLTS